MCAEVECEEDQCVMAADRRLQHPHVFYLFFFFFEKKQKRKEDLDVEDWCSLGINLSRNRDVVIMLSSHFEEANIMIIDTSRLKVIRYHQLSISVYLFQKKQKDKKAES